MSAQSACGGQRKHFVFLGREPVQAFLHEVHKRKVFGSVNTKAHRLAFSSLGHSRDPINLRLRFPRFDVIYDHGAPIQVHPSLPSMLGCDIPNLNRITKKGSKTEKRQVLEKSSKSVNVVNPV